MTHTLVEKANAALAEAAAYKARRIAAIDPMFAPAEMEDAQASDPRRMLIEVPTAEWKEFLREHDPWPGKPEVSLHMDLVRGAIGAGAAPVVYVQAVDVLAIHDASLPPSPCEKKETE